MNSLDGMCALVTGSATGLGAATAIALAPGRRPGYRQLPGERAGSRGDRRPLPSGKCFGEGGSSRCRDRRGLPPAGRRGLRMGPARCIGQQCERDKAWREPGRSRCALGGDFQRLYAVNTIGPFQMIRATRSLLEAGARIIWNGPIVLTA
jgi:3-oxoacyl-[acyl-carrier protein] reductase